MKSKKQKKRVKNRQRSLDGNKGYTDAVQQLRSSGASGTHADVREARLRTRLAQKQAAIEEGNNE